jgi:hypothetical protein
MASRDRRARVLASATVNGVDFVEVANQAQTLLIVHFLNAVIVTLSASQAPTITGGETIPTVTVLPISASAWGWDEGHVTLTLSVEAPGDFSIYTLTIFGSGLDPFFDWIPFSFKAGCPSDFDCAPVTSPCPPLVGDPPPIEYLAKDFLSFRQALLDFSTLRYPAWQERSEADFGMMFLEALSAVADDLSYTQDRIATEATLLTATQRRSVIRHARLVDYEAMPPVSASTWLQFEVAEDVNNIPHGIAATAPAPDGTPVTFETGAGLRDLSDPPPASSLWNRSANVPMRGYWFDDNQQCLQVGATSMWVAGSGWGLKPGQVLLIETQGENPGDPPIRQIVHLLAAGDPGGPPVKETCDDIFTLPASVAGPPYLTCQASPPNAAEAPAAVTRIAWQASDALTTARDLAQTLVIGNIANATQGRTATEIFLVGPPPEGEAQPPPSAIERMGPQPLVSPGVCGTPPVIRMHTLANAPLAWLPQPALDPYGLPMPEIVLTETTGSGVWNWVRNLLLAEQFDQSFTIDPAAYATIAANSDQSVQADYASDEGDTIRFGDSVFGANPNDGMAFAVTYRFGAGSAGNVAADAVSQVDASALSKFFAVDNPLPATGGTDAQTMQSVQRLAPQKFRYNLPRAVLIADYATAAQSLPWVKRAGAQARWTGSWLTMFTTPEPVASEQVAIDQRTQLINLLNRYRMAGTESYVPDPVYISIDLIVELCAEPNAFAAQVKQAVTAALSPTGPGAASAFFAVSRFVFGQPVQRSALEARIQAIPGVAGVTCIEYRLRDQTLDFLPMGDLVTVGPSQIIRCDNDPSRPNNGALAVVVEGGR